jgi:hypothetical protein
MKRVGEIAVDAGLCWVGDPCYVLPDDASNAGQVRDWSKFCSSVGESQTTQFKFEHGHTGLGVAVSTGWGDGMYPVYVEYSEEGRIASVQVVFIEEEEEWT